MSKQEEIYQVRKWDEVTPEGLYNIITSLHNSRNPELTVKVIEVLHERMRDEIPVSYELLRYFLEPIFAQIIEGKSADQAFGLKFSRGGYQRPDTHGRDLCAAALITLRVRKGEGWEDAVADAAEALHISESTAARAYGMHNRSLEHLPNETLESFEP